MCVGVAFLHNNESNEPQNVNKRDHVQESKERLWSRITIIKKRSATGFPFYELSSSVNSGDTNKFYELQQNFPLWTNE